ncbi:MAG: SEC59/DGK1/VTE5 family protein [Oculatellaceae cyanobacterium Prado106]|nr:SEC59/DGK1/VTE5 family protein [Oculatellaceae cyanobacterium Prado106]
MADFFSAYLGAPGLGLQVALVAIWLAIVVAVAESLRRFAGAQPELVRKVVHMGTGNVILIAWLLQVPAWVGIGCSILFSGVTLLSYRFAILPDINNIGRKSLGTFFYAVSIGVLIALFWQNHPYYAALGILVMTWGDGLAALIGQRWGKHPYELWGMKKSWEGSLTMGLVSYIVSMMILLAVMGNSWAIWGVALAIALTAVLLEAFSKWGLDNLTVPLGSATIAFLLHPLTQSLS